LKLNTARVSNVITLA
jgi:hypothetical protein